MTVNNKLIQNMVQINSNSTRTLWIDIAKGLLILSMVVGHSTDLFNQYIYQFHMGAFFILSGYVTDFHKRSILQTVANKFLTLILPLLTMILIFSLFNFLFVKLGIYDNLYKNGTPLLTIDKILKKFFTKGEIWVWWLGACWFFVELFLVSVVAKILYEFFRSANSLLLVALFLFISYEFDEFATTLHLSRMFLLSLFLYVLGYCFRNLVAIIQLSSLYLAFILLTISCALVYFIANKLHCSIDMANGKFNAWYIDLAMIFNGFVLTCSISNMLAKIRSIAAFFSYIGKNTIPIIFFHFAFFKVAFLLLCFFGVVNISYLTNFVPTTEIGRKYWLFISFVAVALSLLVWKVLLKSKYISSFFGANKNLNFYIENKVLCLERFLYEKLSKISSKNHIFSISSKLSHKSLVINLILLSLFVVLSSFKIANIKSVQQDINSNVLPIVSVRQFPTTIHMNSNGSECINGLFDIEPFGRWASNELNIPFSLDVILRGGGGSWIAVTFYILHSHLLIII